MFFGCFFNDPLSMDHPWPMVHSLSMVYGRYMLHVACSLHDPGRGCQDVEAEREVFPSMFFGIFLAGFSCFWLSREVVGSVSQDEDATMWRLSGKLFSPVFLDGFALSSNPTSTCFRISD